ncbi:iron-containing alcohol dehydrogenase [Cloacibacillus sp. An23]|uniref:iron-containing alcohol dehydrogenase n=1 Tax=Cloacibacillus sp. An23 TaxID=1965591 RepID=UPI000B3919C2|nr:iron-containing alcohol dehydrogenase [Cloacibacillus sp. An23]OUO94039.1 hypothetical protein B5F39_05070 [Cloacibacillus sp. An23]
MFNANPGHFHNQGRLNCGVGLAATIGEEIKKRGGKKVLVVTEEVLVKLGVLDVVFESLKNAELEYSVFDKIEADPSAHLMDAIGGQGIKDGANCVLGVGGGSSLDSAKAASILIANPGTHILDYKGDYTGVNRYKNAPVPCFAIPTTAGTGSESSWNIAINDTDNVKKVRAQSPFYVPVFSVLDAKMIATVPASVAAGCGIDAFTHCFEAYISTNGSWAFSDFMALEGMRLISSNIRQYVANPGNQTAAQAMLIGSTLGGMCLSQAALGIVHGLAKPLSAHFHISHGTANALMLPHVVKYTWRGNPAKFAKVAEIMGVDTRDMNEVQAAKAACEAIREMCADIGLPCNLKDAGVDPEAFEQMAKDCIQGKPFFVNPCKGTLKDLIAIYKNAY